MTNEEVTKHNDLIKRLRDMAKITAALAVILPHSEGNAMVELLDEAADAIEKLVNREIDIDHI